jgi:hypothetical protein
VSIPDRRWGSLGVFFAAGSILLFWGGSGAILLFVRGVRMPVWAEAVLLLTCVGYVTGVAGFVITVIGSQQDRRPRIAGLGVSLNVLNTTAGSLMILVFTLPLLVGLFERITHR